VSEREIGNTGAQSITYEDWLARSKLDAVCTHANGRQPKTCEGSDQEKEGKHQSCEGRDERQLLYVRWAAAPCLCDPLSFQHSACNAAKRNDVADPLPDPRLRRRAGATKPKREVAVPRGPLRRSHAGRNRASPRSNLQEVCERSTISSGLRRRRPREHRTAREQGKKKNTHRPEFFFLVNS
jgi:hypothetical protein